jgi:hypothetical protein
VHAKTTSIHVSGGSALAEDRRDARIGVWQAFDPVGFKALGPGSQGCCGVKRSVEAWVPAMFGVGTRQPNILA